jgi:hypothetical protein
LYYLSNPSGCPREANSHQHSRQADARPVDQADQVLREHSPRERRHGRRPRLRRKDGEPLRQSDQQDAGAVQPVDATLQQRTGLHRHPAGLVRGLPVEERPQSAVDLGGVGSPRAVCSSGSRGQ